MKIDLAVALLTCCSMAAFAADTITGVARNQTLGLPAAGDEVILLRPDQGMQEEARTKTDSQGTFTFNVNSPDKLHLVRLVHRGVNYDQRASVGGPVSVDVFEAAAKVQGITGSIEIVRIGTNGNSLHVSDMIEIRNNSAPPLTQAGKYTFDVYLPAHAKIDSVLAAGSDKVATMISAVPVPGEPDHYAVNFSLRPGTTKFSFNYDLPYRGHATFHPRCVVPLQQLAVMIPPTMKFTSRSAAFETLATGNNSYQVEAANQLQAGEGPEFEISGAGVLPPLQSPTQSQSKSRDVALPAPALSRSTDSAMQVQRATTGDPRSPSSSSASSPQSRWFLLGAASILLTGALVFFLWYRQKRSLLSTMSPALNHRSSDSLIESLKDEMFLLEIDRLQSTVSMEEYVSAKRALETILTRCLSRSGASGGEALTPRALSQNAQPTSSLPTRKPPARPFSINA